MQGFKKYFSVRGRISRVEFGIALLLYGVIFTGLIIFQETTQALGEIRNWIFLAGMVPSVWIFAAALAKRMHDIGKPGLTALALFIPIVGPFTLLICLFYPGDRTANLYGKVPGEDYS